MTRPTAPATARVLIDGYYRAMLDKNADDLAALYAENAVHEFPLFSPYFPQRLSGREEIRSHYRRVWGMSSMRLLEMHEIAMHATLDPEVTIAEAKYSAVASAGIPFSLSFLIVVRIREGKIVELRDYMDALGAAVALERVAEMAKALEVRRTRTPV